MKRRNFLSAAFAALSFSALRPGQAFGANLPAVSGKLSPPRRYRPGNTGCPVYRVTPEDGFFIHTFFDISPFSPGGRYLAVTRLPFQDHPPGPGDKATVCVIDLRDGVLTEVYRTAGWAFQLGANVQWGPTERYLYCNDVIEDRGRCVRIDLETGRRRALDGPMYHISPDGSSVIGYPLDLINATQAGYGVQVRRPRTLPPGAAEDQGIWKTDVETGRSELIFPLARGYELLPEEDRQKYKGGTYHFFHSKFNSRGDRIMQVFRVIPPDGGPREAMLLTFRPDGSEPYLALSNEVWTKGGHHPNWCPDGEHILMNLNLDYDRVRLCRFRYDGSGFEVLLEEVPGSGHPSIEPSGRYIVTDTYVGEYRSAESGEGPIRLIDLREKTERDICYMYNLERSMGVLRLDPHPAWSRDFRRVCFNGAPEGRRQVFVADVAEMMEV